VRRHLACAATIAAIWIVVFGWAAGMRWNTPLFPHERSLLLAHDFRVAMGAGVEDGDALSVGAIGDDGNALQLHALGNVRAENFPLLRYRFRDFPRTL